MMAPALAQAGEVLFWILPHCQKLNPHCQDIFCSGQCQPDSPHCQELLQWRRILLGRLPMDPKKHFAVQVQVQVQVCWAQAARGLFRSQRRDVLRHRGLREAGARLRCLRRPRRFAQLQHARLQPAEVARQHGGVAHRGIADAGLPQTMRHAVMRSHGDGRWAPPPV